MRMKSVLCGPVTGVIGGGGEVGFEVVWNAEVDVPVGSVELESNPHRGRIALLFVGPRSVFALSKKPSVADER